MLQLTENIKAKKEHYELVRCWLLIKLKGKKGRHNPNGHQCNKMFCKICSKNLKVKVIHQDIKTVLLEKGILEKLILNTPSELYKINTIVYQKLRVDYGIPEDIIKKGFSDLFVNSGYTSWFTRNGHNYTLAQNLNRSTCTYCNRTYTSTLKSKNNEKIMVPQFDHWFTKSKFPLLALSYHNLIPSCSTCNSSVKSTENFKLNTHTHPYMDDLNSLFSFGYKKKTYLENNVTINNNIGGKIDKRATRSIQALRTIEIYNAHSSTELRDLLDLKYKYNDNYLDILFNKTFKGNISEPDKYRLVFGAEFDDKDFHKRPFSKFKKDILRELKIISG